MAEFNQDDIQVGIKAGTNRAFQEIEYPGEIDPELEYKLNRVLSDWPEDLSPRFIRLFSEISTVVSISRQTYKYPNLEYIDLIAFLGASALFFDSFRHK